MTDEEREKIRAERAAAAEKRAKATGGQQKKKKKVDRSESLRGPNSRNTMNWNV